MPVFAEIMGPMVDPGTVIADYEFLDGDQLCPATYLPNDKPRDTIGGVALILISLHNNAAVHFRCVVFLVFASVVRMYRMGLIHREDE